jgi:hypothetical protein
MNTTSWPTNFCCALFKRTLCGIVIAMSFVTVVPAAAANADDSLLADVQCLLVGTRLESASNGQLRLSGTLLTMYFLGRIDGRAPTADLQKLVLEEATKTSADGLRSAMRRCGKELSARGAEVTQIGKNLQKQGR